MSDSKCANCGRTLAPGEIANCGICRGERFPDAPAALVLGGMVLPTTATCPECGRVFNLLDEDDAGEYHYGHDCERPESPKPLDRPPRMKRNANGGWHCLDCGFLVILFDDDEHDCDVTGTSSNVNPPSDDDDDLS